MAVRSKRQPKRLGDVGFFAEVAECLRTLEHPVRLRMVQFLLHGRYTVGEIADDCKLPGNVASENMRLRQRCGFWAIEREARSVFWQVAVSHLAD
ncbi:ArsR/SmtB family transcription factor [Neorhodopirellula lusitana]|uniref:ArsR/SmtB family transcription factor n=1 Tax=Neorhodopirellula lusitana TaxID=445327 RepID=UPI00384BC8AD